MLITLLSFLPFFLSLLLLLLSLSLIVLLFSLSFIISSFFLFLSWLKKRWRKIDMNCSIDTKHSNPSSTRLFFLSLSSFFLLDSKIWKEGRNEKVLTLVPINYYLNKLQNLIFIFSHFSFSLSLDFSLYLYLSLSLTGKGRMK